MVLLSARVLRMKRVGTRMKISLPVPDNSSMSQQPRSRNNKRARVDEEATKEQDQDVRLCAVLRGLLGGSKYVKQSDLSREMLLSYAIQKGDVVPVTLFTVIVEPLAGDIFDVKMEEKQQRQAASAPHSAGARHASFLTGTLFIAEEWQD